MDAIDAEEPDISEYHHLPDTESLAERVRCCLQESEDVTKDFTSLFDDSLFKFDTTLIPEVVKIYEELDGLQKQPNFEDLTEPELAQFHFALLNCCLALGPSRCTLSTEWHGVLI